MFYIWFVFICSLIIKIAKPLLKQNGKLNFVYYYEIKFNYKIEQQQKQSDYE